MNNTLSKEQVNELKLAIGLLHVKGISLKLMYSKLNEIVEMLQYPEIEIRSMWIESAACIILNGQMNKFKDYMWMELNYLNETKAIQELELSKL